MDVKRYFRGPLLWVLLFGLLVLLVFWGVNPGGSYEKVDTSKIVTEIQSGQIQSAKVVDKDQRIEVTTTAGKKQSASWVDGQGVQLVNMLNDQAKAGKLTGGY